MDNFLSLFKLIFRLSLYFKKSYQFKDAIYNLVLVPYLHQFLQWNIQVLFGTNFDYIWCKFSIITKQLVPELNLLMVLFRINLFNISKHQSTKKGHHIQCPICTIWCKFNAYFAYWEIKWNFLFLPLVSKWNNQPEYLCFWFRCLSNKVNSTRIDC